MGIILNKKRKDGFYAHINLNFLILKAKYVFISHKYFLAKAHPYGTRYFLVSLLELDPPIHKDVGNETMNLPSPTCVTQISFNPRCSYEYGVKFNKELWSPE